MPNRRTLVRTTRCNGVQLTAHLPMHPQPAAGDVLVAIDRWLLGVRTHLLDVASNGSASQRQQPYALGRTPWHDGRTGCTLHGHNRRRHNTTHADAICRADGAASREAHVGPGTAT